jgi:hypothetical protein
MSVTDILEWRPESASKPDAPKGDTRPTPGWDETIAAGFRVTLDPIADVQAGRLDEAYSPVIEALAERTGKKSGDFLKPWYRRTALPFTDNSMLDRDAIWREIDRQRSADPQAFAEIGDRAAFERQVLTRDGDRQRDLETTSRGGIVPTLIGGIPASMRDPLNLASLPIGGIGKTAATRIFSEGLVNAGIEAVQAGTTSRRTFAKMGEDYGVREAAQDVVLGFAAGAAFRGAIEAAPAVDAAGMRIAAPVRDRIDEAFADRDVARALAQAVPESLRTPDQAAAFNVLTRESEIEAVNPFERTYAGADTHGAKLVEAMDALERGKLVPEQPVSSVVAAAAGRGTAVRGVAEGAEARFMERVRSAESGGDDNARNPRSSAAGRYQFTDGTWLAYYKRRYGAAGLTDAQILARKGDGRLQDELMGDLTADNAAALRRAGHGANEGNLYLAHFAGPAGARKALDAPPGMPVERVLGAAAVAANPFLRGKTAGWLIEWAHGKMGSSADAPAAGALADLGDDGSADVRAAIAAEETQLDVARVRADMLQAERPVVTSAGRAVPIAAFTADAIEADAQLMQFKSGGDQFGVTERLQGIEDWDPIAAGMVTVWEAANGRRLIADGHQRLGLARRIQQRGGEPVTLNAFVLREADGFDARDARIITALKNIGEGTGTPADAAKVFREGGEAVEAAVERRLPPRSALVRDGKALARLDDEAFGAVVNEVIPESHGAAIGHLAPDPATHMALVRLLAETDPANRRQAEAMVRQALEAGFIKETQDELFGTRDLVSGVFIQRARLLDRSLRELKKLKGAFGVAARNAEALESGGNRIDVAGSEAAAAANAVALELVERLALRKGNAVNELLDRAARRLADGEPISGVGRDLVAAIRKLDLADLERAGRAADGPGDGPGGSGRFGEPAVQAAESLDELAPAARDQADELGLFGDPPAPDQVATRAFDDAAGDGIKAAAESDWHDIRAGQDPNITARQRQEARLGAEAPMRAASDQDGTIGSPLFDAAEQPKFDLDDGKGPRSAEEIRAEIDADRTALDEIRKCLK